MVDFWGKPAYTVETVIKTWCTTKSWTDRQCVEYCRTWVTIGSCRGQMFVQLERSSDVIPW